MSRESIGPFMEGFYGAFRLTWALFMAPVKVLRDFIWEEGEFAPRQRRSPPTSPASPADAA